MLLGQIFLASPVLQPPQARYISALNHIIQCLFCWARLEMTLFQQPWKVIDCTRTCDLASAFRQCCQITNLTKFIINSRNLGSTLLHKYGLVVLRQHVINFQQRHFGVKDSKHQPLSSSNGSILLGLAGNMRGQGSYAKHWAVHVGTLDFQYHLSTP